ncbi:trehalose-6-phosphate synthase [Tsukamurella soli]|uniref:alpha,alpha-trehalose-phosphate synthase (ADP-forming) n=1 Tax=Tsukamurella soli TaxID=644556 RepID=A0ABP8J5N0_9ACTN
MTSTTFEIASGRSASTDAEEASGPEPAADRASGVGHGVAEFVVVANRLPVDIVQDEQGVSWNTSPGGLVTALEPILRARRGAWVGWAGAADVEVDPMSGDDMTLHPVRLSEREVIDYYEGLSNAGLWPLYHDVIVKPEYRREWWDAYAAVNRRFAETASRAAAEGATVWVQDYQLQLVPRMLRTMRPDLKIGFFLHIPFPPVELFLQMPWRTEIIEGILGADLVGFHLPGGAQNFLYLVRRLTGLPTSRGNVGTRSRFGAVAVGARTVRVGAFPISVDSSTLEDRARSADVRAAAERLRSELGNPETIMLGVDRLDYTKGIDVRLHAVGELYAQGRLDPTREVLVQLATPSRERVGSYRAMRDDIEREVGRINGDFGRVGSPAVHYLHHSVSIDELVAFYVAADVMLVTPLRDGMNLVAKEYVACQADDGGALVLSEFTGAAAELRQAYQCNPHDLEDVKNAIDAAVHRPAALGRRRMRAMRRQVLQYDVALWARSFLDALSADNDGPEA